jgi:hypothetical protein
MNNPFEIILPLALVCSPCGDTFALLEAPIHLENCIEIGWQKDCRPEPDHPAEGEESGEKILTVVGIAASGNTTSAVTTQSFVHPSVDRYPVNHFFTKPSSHVLLQVGPMMQRRPFLPRVRRSC